MINALLLNRQRMDLAPAPVRFPIEDYATVYKNLEDIGIGSVMKRDCFVSEISCDYSVLKRLEESEINVDELDYLAKRLESFSDYELTQFQGTVVSKDLSDMTDLINLTFCCQSVTVIQDFTNLSAVGCLHYMSLYGGLAEDDFKTMDFQRIALSLILYEEGSITPYGVVYENGMKLEQLYGGKYFPYYRHNNDILLTVAIMDQSLLEEIREVAWLYLPAEDCQIERTLIRAEAHKENIQLRYDDGELPAILVDMLGTQEDIYEINRLCVSFQELSNEYPQKPEVVLQMVSPTDITKALNILTQLDLFDFIPDISTPEEYGKYMIIDSGHYEYDENLEDYVDFKGYGEKRIFGENGKFTKNGYVSYHGFISIEEIMAGIETERMDIEMGGMQLE